MGKWSVKWAYNRMGIWLMLQCKFVQDQLYLSSVSFKVEIRIHKDWCSVTLYLFDMSSTWIPCIDFHSSDITSVPQCLKSPASQLFFSSAADIVSGAYPMPSHPSSVSPLVRLSGNLFSNQIGCLSFHPIFLIFGLYVHNNIAQKVRSGILIFWVYFFQGIFNYKEIGKNGNFRGFWPFSRKGFNMRPWNLVYRHIMGTNVWQLAPVGQIFRPFLSPNRVKIGQYIGFRLFPWKVSSGFTPNLIYNLIGATF